MSTGSVLVASDIHLGVTPQPMEEAFLEWLEFAEARASTLLINGDLFDFWFEYGSVIPAGYTRVLGALSRIADTGVKVHLMGGNHDWWGGRHLEEEVGVVFHREPVTLELAGHRTLVAHGDGLGRGDLGYRLLRTVLRSRVTRAGFRWIHPDVGTWIARRVSRTHVYGGPPLPRQEARAAELERWARERLLSEPELDLILLGHTHIPAKVEVASGRFYLNSGDWITHATYVELQEGSPPALRRWPEDVPMGRSNPSLAGG